MGKLSKFFYTLSFKKYFLILALTILIITNFLLLHKYNIFIGDDAYLLTYITKFNFFGFAYQVVCQDVKFVELLIRLMGPFYEFYFGVGFEVIKFLELEIIWLRLFSFFLYLIAFYFFQKIVKYSKYYYYFLIIFLTLEPYLSMSHSLRHDIVIFLGINLLFYRLISIKSEFKQNYILFFSWILLITHPSGYPFLIISIIYEFLFNKKNLLFLFISGLIVILIFLYSKNLLNLNNIFNLIDFIRVNSLENNLITNSAFTSKKFYDYFWLAKYKRHIIEILIFFIYFISFKHFNALNFQEKFILLIPIMVLLIFYLLNYFNVSYLKHLYLICLFSAVVVSRKANLNIIQGFLIKITAFLFLVVFVCIAVIFLPHNSWKNLNINNSKIGKHISSDKVTSAPFYFLFIKSNINFIPISALGKMDYQCFPKNFDKNQIDTIILDTNILDKIKNKDPVYKNINNFLKNYRLVDKIYIGRLGTQNLNTNGFIYIYNIID
jgi:hypothetical protein